PRRVRRCVRDAGKGLEKEDGGDLKETSMLQSVRKASCAKKKTPKHAIACCLENTPEANIVTGQLCAAISANKCTLLGGTSAGDGISCLPTNPCGFPAD